jgi:hypothetical protein
MSDVRSEREIQGVVEERIRSERFENISGIDNIVFSVRRRHLGEHPNLQSRRIHRGSCEDWDFINKER